MTDHLLSNNQNLENGLSLINDSTNENVIKVLLDPQIFMSQKVGGVSRQFVEVWQHLHDYSEIQISCPLLFSENYHLETSGVSLKGPLTILHHRQFRGISRIKGKLFNLSEYYCKKILSSKKTDIFLPTFYNPYFINSLNGTPFVLSVFDMIYELFPQYFPPGLIMVQNKKKLLYKSTRIIVHSIQTKKDLLKFYPDLDTSKIDLVHLASSVGLQNEMVNSTSNFSHPYLLYVGRRDTYKNFPFFLQAVKDLLIGKKLHLICTGGDPFSESEILLIKALNLEDVVFQKDISAQELPLVYKHARAFIFPSEYEGFGLPVLEAMACGCPVVLADNGVFREIGGEAALYFDLNNEQMLKHRIEQVLEDESLRKSLIKKGFEREKQFSWELTAKGYYNSILKALKYNIAE